MDAYERVVWFLTTVGGLAAAGVAWWFQVKGKSRADARARRREEAQELEEQAIPYRQAFKDQQKDLEKTRSGLDKLQSDHTEALVRIARLESDNANCQATNARMMAENDRIASELMQSQKDIRALQSELMFLRGSRGPSGEGPQEPQEPQGTNNDRSKKGPVRE